MTFTVRSFTTPAGTPLRYGIITPPGAQPADTLPIFVYVPGLGGSIKKALDFLDALAQQTNHLVYSMDARGFGLNEGIRPTVTPAGYLNDFQRFMHHLNQTQPAFTNATPTLIGISLGGALSVLAGVQHPHLFRGCVLLAPAFQPHPDCFSAGFKLANAFKLLTLGPMAKTTLPYNIYNLTQNEDKHQDPNFGDPFVMPTFYLFLVEALCQKALRACARLHKPVLMIEPVLDQICAPQAMADGFARCPHPNKQYERHDTAFHDLTIEPADIQQPILNQINDWLGTLEGSDTLLSPVDVLAAAHHVHRVHHPH
ncbi:MAG: alpha/beta fold hydrolase [Cyanobacteria bacterium HKST-UBA03]|nr:alpha/beta fold hydrolase [Cyanobacteria bacterium HKST-UBA03]